MARTFSSAVASGPAQFKPPGVHLASGIDIEEQASICTTRQALAELLGDEFVSLVAGDHLLGRVLVVLSVATVSSCALTYA
jgi:hypothetical protein